VIFAFVTLLGLMMPQLNSNLETSAKEQKIRNKLFDILLWLNLPIIYGVLIYSMYQFSAHNYRVDEIMGLVFSLGIVSGRNGINVVHELGNRQEP
jgi:alkane 1-monooxygenase